MRQTTLGLVLLLLVGLRYRDYRANQKKKAQSLPGLPAEVKICTQRPLDNARCVAYRIVIKGLGGEIVGYTDVKNREIQIDPDESGFAQAEILTHEIWHAVLNEDGMNLAWQNTNMITAHVFISNSQEGWTRFLHDNPEYVKYVSQSY
jgi:hypothetical protein